MSDMKPKPDPTGEKKAGRDQESSAGRSTSSPRMLSRRDVLIRGGTTVAVAGLAGYGAWRLYDPVGDAGLQSPPPITLRDYFSPVEFPASAPRISAAYGDFDKIRQMVDTAVKGLHPDGFRKFIAKGDTVMIKPNVGFDRGPTLGATTNPDVIRAVVELCRDAGAGKVIVADNPIEDPAACFAKSGIKKAAESAGAEVMIHSSTHDAPVAVRDRKPDSTAGEALGTWPIFWAPLERADKVIGVPPIKDHNLCSASMSMKNWYGLLGGRRNQFHQAIHNIVSDLGFMMKPTLIVADATRVMMKHGPTGGRQEDLKIGGEAGRPVIVASVDQLAGDSWCYQNLLGRDPAGLSYLKMAYDKFGHDPKRLTAPNWHEYKAQGKVVESRLG